MTSEEQSSASSSQVLYPLPDLVAEVEKERPQTALGGELLDTLEIDTLFAKAQAKRSRKRKRTPASKKNLAFLKLIQVADPPIPVENQKILEEALESGLLDGLEDAVKKDLVSQKQAGEIWASYIHHTYVNPLESVVTPEALAALPEEIARKARVLPLYIVEGVLTLACDDPGDSKKIARLRNIARMKISPVFSLPSQIRDAQEIHYAREENISDYINTFEKDHGFVLQDLSDAELKNIAESKPVAKIVEAIIHWAIREDASDIHIEPMEGLCRIRFRIDGNLRSRLNISKGVFPAITSRFRVLTNVNIAESRFPQDGRFSLSFGSQRADFRVSFIPVRHGTKTVIRILGSTGRNRLMTLEEMLISPRILKPWRQVIRSPNGIVFVTGPTGSGKTTTLYGSLQELNADNVNICTIEDPIEIEMPGLNQSQVNPHIDLNFSILLRSLLRQDPDILLVGEIRDRETARIAAEAALTGHLVFATLHTNSAIQAVTRLREIGLENYMVAPSLNAVLGQRLAARLLEDTKESYRPKPDVLSRFFSDHEESDVLFYRPKSGLKDPYAGFRGRVAFHELFLVSDEMRSLLANDAGPHELSEAARTLGYRPLRYDGLKKAMLGLTTLEEIERVTPVHWKAREEAESLHEEPLRSVL
mgnify:CR=1 FL=1